MKNKKGFTLIELLAVIVILSVLILIALPSVLNIMNKARKDAFKDEATSIVRAAENAYIASDLTESCTISYVALAESKYVSNKKGYHACINFDEYGKINYINITNDNNGYSATGKDKNNITVDTTGKPVGGCKNFCTLKKTTDLN